MWQIATENVAPRSLCDDNQRYLLMPPRNPLGLPSSPRTKIHGTPKALAAATTAGWGDALRHSKYNRFRGAQSHPAGQPALPPPSTKPQLRIRRFRWYLWADILGVTSSPLEAGGRAARARCSRITLRAVFHLAGPCYGPLGLTQGRIRGVCPNEKDWMLYCHQITSFHTHTHPALRYIHFFNIFLAALNETNEIAHGLSFFPRKTQLGRK